MTGDPIAAWVNGWKIAGTSNDIILQIMKSEMSRNVAGDKFARVSNIFGQGHELFQEVKSYNENIFVWE